MDLPHLEGLTTDADQRLLAFERSKDPSLAWEQLKWLVATSRLPVWLKGVMRAEDALRAVEHGVSGLILSNHGGRQLDSSPSALAALPSVKLALDKAGHDVPVLIDGGIRRVNTSSKPSRLVQTLSWLGGPLFGDWRHQAKPVFRECLAPCKKS